MKYKWNTNEIQMFSWTFKKEKYVFLFFIFFYNMLIILLKNLYIYNRKTEPPCTLLSWDRNYIYNIP